MHPFAIRPVGHVNQRVYFQRLNLEMDIPEVGIQWIARSGLTRLLEGDGICAGAVVRKWILRAAIDVVLRSV